jgi:hypothetical protein
MLILAWSVVGFSFLLFWLLKTLHPFTDGDSGRGSRLRQKAGILAIHIRYLFEMFRLKYRFFFAMGRLQCRYFLIESRYRFRVFLNKLGTFGSFRIKCRIRFHIALLNYKLMLLYFLDKSCCLSVLNMLNKTRNQGCDFWNGFKGCHNDKSDVKAAGLSNTEKKPVDGESNTPLND